MTWHQWHQTAPMSSRIGLSWELAREKASSPHSYQAIGWCAAERRYGLAEFFRRFSFMAIGWLEKLPWLRANGAGTTTGGVCRDRGREDRAASGPRNLRPDGDNNECDLHRASSTSRLPGYPRLPENRANQYRDP